MMGTNGSVRRLDSNPRRRTYTAVRWRFSVARRRFHYFSGPTLWREQKERQSLPLPARFYRLTRHNALWHSTRPDDRSDAASSPVSVSVLASGTSTTGTERRFADSIVAVPQTMELGLDCFAVDAVLLTTERPNPTSVACRCR